MNNSPGPQLTVDKKRCQLRGADITLEQPEQEPLVPDGQRGPDGTNPQVHEAFGSAR